MDSTRRFINIAAYRFVSLHEDDLPELQQLLRYHATQADLKGTILLATEGINVMMAGRREGIDQFIEYLNSFKEFAHLTYKKSISAEVPFQKIMVRIKPEIITMACSGIDPAKETATHLSPQQFHDWYQQGHDMVVLDTRNDFEVQMGTFEQVVNLHIDSFREFPKALAQLPESCKDKPVVTFCTGGVRCEKATALMLQQGYKKVYQLEGGILNYFEQCGGDHYQGDCFVFDERISLDSGLQPRT